VRAITRVVIDFEICFHMIVAVYTTEQSKLVSRAYGDGLQMPRNVLSWCCDVATAGALCPSKVIMSLRTIGCGLA
jgi:hypothetical protein